MLNLLVFVQRSSFSPILMGSFHKHLESLFAVLGGSALVALVFLYFFFFRFSVSNNQGKLEQQQEHLQHEEQFHFNVSNNKQKLEQHQHLQEDQFILNVSNKQQKLEQQQHQHPDQYQPRLEQQHHQHQYQFLLNVSNNQQKLEPKQHNQYKDQVPLNVSNNQQNQNKDQFYLNVSNKKQKLEEQQHHQHENQFRLNVSNNQQKLEQQQNYRQCDFYSGKWVQDQSYPLYPPRSCSYISSSFNCAENGREDSGYTHWRWQPHDCEIPRINATRFLERLRGKKLMFVGDSLNRGQWESLLCILGTVVHKDRWSHAFLNQTTTIFFAKDYNCSVAFFWAPFLVEHGQIKLNNENRETLNLRSIQRFGSVWRDADVLIFNSGHWWQHPHDDTHNFYQEGDYVHPQLKEIVAFEKAMVTWANWVDENLDSNKTKVFFRSWSPMHPSSNQWKKKGNLRCYGETQPFLNEGFINPYPERMRIVERILENMRFPVTLMNITKMSDFRKDAHCSIFVTKDKHPIPMADCSHWCLPGLPDTWNELLYASLISGL